MQRSEPAVQSRRNLLAALGVWVAALWTSTKSWASPPSGGGDPELTMVVGRLCIDPAFRAKFFGTADDTQAIDDTEMVKRKDIRESLVKIRKAQKTYKASNPGGDGKSSEKTEKTVNPVNEACGSVYDALATAQALIPCNPWPC